MRYLVSAMLLVAALIHILPVSGVLSVEQLSKLYGISIADPNLEILMRHRAVLFALLGSLLAAAAFIPSLQLTAFIAGFVSVGSFLAVAWHVGGYNAQIGRVVIADLAAVVCLVIGLAAYVWTRRAA